MRNLSDIKIVRAVTILQEGRSVRSVAEGLNFFNLPFAVPRNTLKKQAFTREDLDKTEIGKKPLGQDRYLANCATRLRLSK